MDLQDLLFSGKFQKNAKAGSLLISEPLMDDSYFSRSVILLLDEPEDGGHFGLILNKPTGITLNDFMPEWEEGRRVPVFCGGPVDMERMFMLHSLRDEFGSSFEVAPGIFVGGDLDKVIEYVDNGGEIDGKIRFFVGYCGWSPGQLQNELTNKTWAVGDIGYDVRLLKGQGMEFWREEVAKLGESFRSWLMVPPDPSMN